jgi:cytochrome c553/uncharacterized protein (DUF302 family)
MLNGERSDALRSLPSCLKDGSFPINHATITGPDPVRPNMKKSMLPLLLLILPIASQAANLANGEAINKTCALCHGTFGQGTPGMLSPRIAGMQKDYLVKAIHEYIDGKRVNPLMVQTSGLDKMTKEDVEDVAAYLAAIDLTEDARFDVSQSGGDSSKGEEIFMDECKSCHGSDGFGKEKKKAPALAGQHHEYLYSTIKLYQSDNRVHDDDPEDELFDEYADNEILDMTAHLVTLDDARFKPDGRIKLPEIKVAAKQESAKKKVPGLQITDISQTVAQVPLNEGVSIEDAILAMESKAAELNLKLVGRQDVSKELQARGVETPYLSILQFCDPMDARTMIVSNPIYASYMPCRIALVEDQQKKPILMMLNLDMLINSELVDQKIVETAIKVNQSMLDIMMAGATGEF